MATQRVSFDFDAQEYKNLKLCCAKLGVKLREFVSTAIIQAVYNQEEEWIDTNPKQKQEEKGENYVLVDHEGNYYEL